MNYMDLGTPVGAKIIFHGQGGYDGCRSAAERAGLIAGSEYTVKSLRIYQLDSSVELSEIPNARFNTVMFSNKEVSRE